MLYVHTCGYKCQKCYFSLAFHNPYPKHICLSFYVDIFSRNSIYFASIWILAVWQGFLCRLHNERYRNLLPLQEAICHVVEVTDFQTGVCLEWWVLVGRWMLREWSSQSLPGLNILYKRTVMVTFSVCSLSSLRNTREQIEWVEAIYRFSYRLYGILFLSLSQQQNKGIPSSPKKCHVETITLANIK